jgi:hypothetical protein
MQAAVIKYYDSMFVFYVIMRHSGLMKKKVTVLKRDVIYDSHVITLLAYFKPQYTAPIWRRLMQL